MYNMIFIIYEKYQKMKNSNNYEIKEFEKLSK